MKKVDLPLREILEFPTIMSVMLLFSEDNLDEVGICHRNGKELALTKYEGE